MSVREFSSPKVLLVEDSDVQALDLRRALEAEGYAVARANSAERALELLNEDIPDLVIADLELPNMDGRELTRQLRSNARTRAVPVVIVTSATARENERTGLESGADAYVPKTRDHRALITRMHALLRRSRQEQVGEGALFRRARLLLLESGKTQRLHLQENLRIDFDVDGASDIETAVSAIGQDPGPDCVLVNLLDVKFDAATACARLAEARDAALSVGKHGFLIVAFGGQRGAAGAAIEAAFAAGADDVVPSLADLDLLRLRLRALVRRQAMQAESLRLDAERAKAQAAAELFKILVEGVVDYALYLLEPDGRVATWNAGAERIKLYGADEVTGSHFSVFYTEADRAAGEPQRALEIARTQGRYETEGQRVRKDGSTFWAHVVIDRIVNEDGEITGYAKITRDITERRQTAEELQEARTALMQAQKMEAIGQLTGGIAHDFNNMLAGIIGGLSLIQRRIEANRTNETGELIQAALTSANRAAALTSRLLAFGRRQSLDLRPIDVNGVVGSMRMLLERTLGENVQLETNFKAPELWARTDVSQLESAILNLVINARDAMPDGGRLAIETKSERLRADAGAERRAGEYALVTVRDTGAGIPPELMQKVFDPFFTTKPIGHGTGLGLSMVYGFMRQAGGHVEIESAPGRGTSVTLFLPISSPAEVEPAGSAAVTASGDGERVLVVEDDPQVRLLVGEVLGELGYEAVSAQNGPEAIEILKSSARIDLLISDVGLPGIDGRKLAEVARELRPGIAILFITGYAEHASVRGEFLGEGMAMILKPFAIEDLADKVHRMLPRKSSP